MSDPADIATTLLARCSTLAVGSPALPIAYPDVPFTPPDSGKYLEVSIFYNRPAWEGLKAGRMDQGILQVTVVGPKGQGIPALMRLASDVMDHFPKALALANGVRIAGQPYASSPLLDAADSRVPVTIPWVAA
jgi:hypothetical protein